MSQSDPSGKQFVYTSRHYGGDENLMRLVTQKGVYPYEYMDSETKFLDPELPPVEAFYSKLADENVTAEEYIRAEEVWSVFEMKTMHDYHDLYLKTDVLLLADVFETFRNVSFQKYGLDCMHYITLSSFSWLAMLKFTGVKLELFTEPEQLLFVERGVRGGVASIANRYSKANNKEMVQHDPVEESKYILYLDANNLYGWAMSRPLPLREFKFLSESEVIAFPMMLPTLTEHDTLGYILEVDLEYPEELHDAHNDYPLAPEHFKVPNDQLSPYAKELLEKFGGKLIKLGRES